jgi:hypothetical protein
LTQEMGFDRGAVGSGRGNGHRGVRGT